MSSFINAKHLKVMLGQDSPIEKAWANYYGLEVLTHGLTLLPYAIERYYPYTRTSEWELAMVRMIIHCSDLVDGPVAIFELQDFADRFHLSTRQINRKIKAMVEKGLLLVTPIYDDKGKKTKSKSYDCNPFLDKIFACICTDDDWQSQHSELLTSLGIDEEADDIDVLSMRDAEQIVVPAPTASERTQMSSGVLPGTYMSSPLDIILRTSMSSPSDINSRTSMSPQSDINSRTSMSSPSDINSRTSMSSPSENPTSYAHAHAHTRALGSNSNSNSNSININTSINILSSNSNSNSNSKHTKFQIFATEDDRTGMITTRSGKQGDVEDVQMSSGDEAFEQASTPDDADARFELWVLDAIEQANQADDEMSRATEPVGQPEEHIRQAVEQAVQAIEQACEASVQIQQQEQLQHLAREHTSSKREDYPLTIVAAQPAESIEKDDRTVSAATTDDPDHEQPELLQGRSKAALTRISNGLHDAHPHSSRGRARTLYNHLLRINQAEDEYTLSDPDMYFSDLMLTVQHHIGNKTFRSKDSYGQPNGMPLFFHELRKRVEDQVTAVEEMRKDGDYLRMYHERRKSAADQDTISDAQDTHDLYNYPDPELRRQQAVANEVSLIVPTDTEIVAHAQRMQIPMSAEEIQALLDGTATAQLRLEMTIAVRLGLYDEILKAQPSQDTCTR